MSAAARGPGPVSRALARPLALGVRVYQAALRPVMGGQCRFHPSCSEYALEALRVHGAARGGWLAMRRVLRCRPFGGWGYDPVPAGGDDEPAPAPAAGPGAR